jgi:DNA helicase IV
LEETAVLSCKTNGSSIQELVTTFSKNPAATPIDGKLENGLICTTIRRFKGLERFGIIVTDIDNSNQKSLAELLYIASTRAVGHLTLLVHEEVIKDLIIEEYLDAA